MSGMRRYVVKKSVVYATYYEVKALSDEQANKLVEYGEGTIINVATEKPVFTNLLPDHEPEVQGCGMKNLWKDNRVQFARLLAEINSVGLSETQIEQLCNTMDLTEVELFELFDRAEIEFQDIKERLC